jgi:hypothetical protein
LLISIVRIGVQQAVDRNDDGKRSKFDVDQSRNVSWRGQAASHAERTDGCSTLEGPPTNASLLSIFFDYLGDDLVLFRNFVSKRLDRFLNTGKLTFKRFCIREILRKGADNDSVHCAPLALSHFR